MRYKFYYIFNRKYFIQRTRKNECRKIKIQRLNYLIALLYITHALNNSLAEDLNHLLGGMVAGLAQCVVLVPSDVIKVNMQADDVDASGKRKYSGSLNCMFHILKTENIRGLYKGSIYLSRRH